MKKIFSILLFLGLIPMVIQGQTVTENYVLTTTFKSPVSSLLDTEGTYETNFSSSDIINFFGSVGGGGSAKVTIENGNELTFFISGSWSSSTNLRLGNIGPINFPRALPDMDLGEIKTSSGVLVGRHAEIKNGQLYFDIHTYVSSPPANCNTTINETIDFDILSYTSITYVDGLGRSKQSIRHKAGGNGEDLVTHYSYDNIGRQDKEYLPYARTVASLNFESNNLESNLNQQYLNKFPGDLNSGTPNPYSQKEFEGSPLNRLKKQAAPGYDWRLGGDHEVRFDYGINNSEDHVRKFSVNFPTNNKEQPAFSDNGYYGVGELNKKVIKDENWRPTQFHQKARTIEEYTDKQGRLILKRTFVHSKWHDTYYVYDDYGNLTYVLPPKVNSYTNVQAWDGQLFELFLDDGSPASEVGVIYYNGHDIEETMIEISFNTNGYMYVNFEGYFGSQNAGLNPRIEIPLTFDPPLPDMFIGNIEGDDYYEGWTEIGEMSIEDNMIVIESEMLSNQSAASTFELNANINLTSLLNNQTVNLPISQNSLNDLGYQYKYDHRNRLIEKKLPGKGVQYIVYDKLDRPILTQDAIQGAKTTKEWIFTKYDALGRVIYTGLHYNNNSRSTIQSIVDGQSVLYENKTSSAVSFGSASLFYSNNAYPTSIHRVYSINYYDSYTDLPSGLNPPLSVYDQPVTNSVQSLSTVNKVRVLGTNDWIISSLFYDAKGRLIYTHVKNEYSDITNTTKHKLDFIGNIVETENFHQKSGQSPIITTDYFTYDLQDRLTSQSQKVNSQPIELIAKNQYDELGQLVKKDVGNTEVSPLQEIDYDYNIRGWLKKINDPHDALGTDLFSMEFHYNTNTTGVKLYNGNIAQTYWKTASDNATRYYRYYYDDLDRITSAYYYAWSQASRFNIGSLSYDKNGNIQRLYRRGAIVDNPVISNAANYGTMDYLRYEYDGNQLLKVTDTGNKDYGFIDGTNTNNDYTYDLNGNMTQDENKGITDIDYNFLNLPTKVTINGNTIDYVYDATGTKHLKKVTNGANITNTYYDGNYVYEQINSGSTNLQYFAHSEGYVAPALTGGFEYIYQYKDQVKNTRLTYKENTDMSQQVVFSDGFESISNWDGTGNSFGWALSAIDSSRKYSGTYSGRIDDNYPTNWERYVNCNTWVPINNAQDTYYTISAWIFIEDIPDNDAEIFLMTRRAGETGYPTGNYSTKATERGSWIFVEKSVNVPADVRELNFRIDNNKDGTVWFDDVKIVKGNTSQTIIVQESNYYPFGLQHAGYNNVVNVNINETAQKIKTFQGQELVNDVGLNWHLFKWRNYDASLARFHNIDPLAEDYSYQSPYNFSENRLIDGVELEGMEYLTIHHYANGAVSQTEYYKMSDAQINRLGGTTAGWHNSVAYGSQGKGIEHKFYDKQGNVTRVHWEMRQTNFKSDLRYHGLFSGPGAATDDGLSGSVNYSFDLQPIDWADAIAKRHDEDYAAVAGENYAGYMEDIRTLKADLDMINRIDALVASFLNPLTDTGVSGVDTPFRTSYSTEMDGTLMGQRVVIKALATYKKWKIKNNLGNNDLYIDNREAFAKDHWFTAQILDLVKN